MGHPSIRVSFFQTCVIFGLACANGLSGAQGLVCYKCSSFTTTGSGLVQGIIDGFEEQGLGMNPACISPGVTDTEDIELVVCDNDQVCGSMDGIVKISIPIYGSMTYKTLVRDCIPSAYYSDSGCDKNVQTAVDIVNVFISTINDIPLVDVKVDGNVCYCSSASCVAGGCNDDQIKVNDQCFEIWIVAVVAVASIALLIILLTCCCCCCGCCGCCSCFKRSQPIQVTTHFANPLAEIPQDQNEQLSQSLNGAQI